MGRDGGGDEAFGEGEVAQPLEPVAVGLERVEVRPRGDLAEPLSAAVGLA